MARTIKKRERETLGARGSRHVDEWGTHQTLQLKPVEIIELPDKTKAKKEKKKQNIPNLSLSLSVKTVHLWWNCILFSA